MKSVGFCCLDILVKSGAIDVIVVDRWSKRSFLHQDSVFRDSDHCLNAFFCGRCFCAGAYISSSCYESVAALVPQAELDGEMGDSHVALQARLMNQVVCV